VEDDEERIDEIVLVRFEVFFAAFLRGAIGYEGLDEVVELEEGGNTVGFGDLDCFCFRW
jgi:hypothetical protein